MATSFRCSSPVTSWMILAGCISGCAPPPVPVQQAGPAPQKALSTDVAPVQAIEQLPVKPVETAVRSLDEKPLAVAASEPEESVDRSRNRSNSSRNQSEERTRRRQEFDPQTIEKLTNSFLGRQMGTSSTEGFHGQIQQICNAIPELTVVEGNEPVKWQKVKVTELTLPVDNSKHSIALFKFRSKLDQPADLHWAFAVPEALGEWHIVPAKGAMNGFERFHMDRMFSVPDVSLPRGSLFVFQELMDGRILPGQEYIIWYIPSDPADREMLAALRLTRQGTHQSGGSVAEISQSLGVASASLEFPQTSEGLRDAYAMAHRLLRHDPNGSQRVPELLRTVWNQLPKVQVSTNNGEAVWNHVSPDVSFRFLAIRFTSSLVQPADLNLGYVVANDELRWGIVSQEDQLDEPDAYRLEIDCPIPGIANSKKNLAYFHLLGHGRIQPQTEYAIWFMPRQGALPDWDIAMNLTTAKDPAKIDPLPSKRRPDDQQQEGENQTRAASLDVQAIGLKLGLQVPKIPSPERIATALEMCGNLALEGRSDSKQFQALIQFAIPGLPEMDPDAGWTKFELNQNGKGVAAFRVATKRASKARVVSVVARPASMYSQLHQNDRRNRANPRFAKMPIEHALNWGVVDPGIPGIHLAKRHSQSDITMLGPSIPANTSVDYDVYDHWDFEHDGSYVMVFAPVTKEPMTVHAAVRIDTDAKLPAANDVVSVLDSMGLRKGDPENPGRALGRIEGDFSAIHFIDNDTVVSGSSIGEVNYWHLGANDAESTAAALATMSINSFSADGSKLVAVNYDRVKATVCDARSLDNPVDLRLPDGLVPRSFSFSQDGKSLLAAALIGTEGLAQKSAVYRWNLDQNVSVQRHSLTPGFVARTSCWLPDGRIITAGEQIRVTNQQDPTSRTSRQSSFKFRLAEAEIQFLDGATFATLDTLKDEGPDWTDVAVSADGKRLAGIAYSGWITVWDTTTRKTIVSVPVDTLGRNIRLSQDGHRLLSVGVNGQIRVWDQDSRRLLGCGPGRMPLANQAAISPDGNRVVVGCKDRQIKLFNVSSPGSPKGEDSEPIVLTDSIGLQLNWIPSGSFTMGRSEINLQDQPQMEVATNSRERAQQPRHMVHFALPFYMGRFEVTVGQFRKFVEETEYRTTAEASGKGGSYLPSSYQEFKDDPKLNWKNPGFPQAEDHPVVHVSYDDAIAFCNWLSGKTQAKYRLPTEAEWEYCCRAGTSYVYYYGSNHGLLKCSNSPDQELIKVYGSFQGAYGNSDGYAYTAPVGSYVPNGFSLFDMHGNVWEWCSDWYDENYYANSPPADPPGPKDGTIRVQRGGSYLFRAQAGWRDFGPPDQAQCHLGFRVVREIK